MMPRFFKDMPKMKAGKYRASVIIQHGTRSKEVWSREFKGLLRAYLAVRIKALIEDCRRPHFYGEIGIQWEIEKCGQ